MFVKISIVKIANICKICTTCFLIFANLSNAFTEKEMAAIQKLRSGLGDKLTHDFMKTDEYLLRWLTAKNMDVKNAKEMLEKSLKWRKENNIDKIMEEDFALFEKQYPVKLDGVDKEGRPVVTVHFGNWVPRKAAQNAQISHLVRYMIRAMLEKPRIKAEELSKETGKPGTRVTTIVDLSGYNLKEHACLQCFGLYTQFIQLYENNYPETFNKVFIVNAPTIFETILELIKPLMSPASKRDFIMHGLRKADWQKAVLKLIDADQLSPQYGGTKKSASG